MSIRFTTLTARFAGTCKRCRQPISIGERIRYGGKGLTYHLATDCDSSVLQVQPEPAQLMTATIAASIQQTFADLLNRPARLIDYAEMAVETAQDAPETDISECSNEHRPADMGFTFEVPGLGVKWQQPLTAQPAAKSVKPTTLDSDLF